MVRPPTDGSLESPEAGNSFLVDEQRMTMAGDFGKYSFPYRLLPKHAIQWSYPPEHKGIKFASGRYEVIDRNHVRLAVLYHESPIEAAEWPGAAWPDLPEKGVDYYLLIRTEALTEQEVRPTTNTP